ncbi:MAG TPA: LamG domain-containing protein, partial [Ferruginibacter sp.]|nr:LamG domain-containing protein [Ferruginibacter sp.]
MKQLATLALLLFCTLFSHAQIPAPGNILWLKADAGAYSDAGITPAVNGQTVQQWNDQSGNANHAAQATAGLRPVFVTNVLNGQPALRFSTHMLVTPSLDLTGTDKVDLYIVYKSSNLTGTWEAIAEHGPDYNTFKGFALFDNAQAPLTYRGMYPGHTGNGYNTKNYPFKANVFKVVNSSFDRAAGVAGEVNLRINGKDCVLYEQSAPYNNDNSGNYDNRPLYIGNRGNAVNSFPLVGDIAEIILYNRKLTPAEKISIENYLNSKYGIQCSVNNPLPGSGNCLRMGTYGAYAQDDADIDFGSNDFTIEFWTMKRALSSGGSNSACINKWNTGSSPGTNEWAIATSTDGNNNIPAFYFETGATYYQANATTSLAINKWYHIAAAREGNNIKIYVNGLLEGTTAIPPGSSVNNVAARTYLAMGYYPGGFGNNSDLDEVRIWNTALSQTTIRDWMCKKETASHPNHGSLARYYRFDEASGLNIWGNQLNNCVTELYSNGGTTAVSGAPIGDVSAYNYTANTASANINFGTPADNLAVTMNAGTSAGVHVYGVNELPNTQNYPGISGNNKYAGVFVVNGNGAAAYTVTCNYTNNTTITPSVEANLKLYKRTDNADANWVQATPQSINTSTKTITATGQNTEYILGSALTPVPPSCAVTLSGASGEGLFVPNSAAVNLTTAFTYETWINASADISNYRCIFGKGPVGSAAPMLLIASAGSGNGGKLNGYYTLGGTLYSFITPATVNDNTWHHVAFTYDGSYVRVYIDGIQNFQQAASGVLTSNAGTVDIGYGFANGNYPFIGKLDEFRVWNVARTGTEIQNTMNGSLTGTETGLVAYYTFNDNTYNGTGQTVINHASATGTALNAISNGTASLPVFDCPNTSMPGLQSPNCAIQFDGAAKVTANGMGNMPAKGTVEFWIKPRSFSNYQAPLAMFNVPANGNNGLYFTINASGQIFGLIGSDNATYTAPIFATLGLNTLSHIAMSWDTTAKLIKYYVNGKLVLATGNPYWPTVLNTMYIGTGRVIGTDFFNGDMDEVRFWNVERTQAEIIAHAQGITGTESGLVAYYHFNENTLGGNGQTVLNKCTATGAALNGLTSSSSSYPKFPCAINIPTCGIQLNGTGDKISVPDNPSLNFAGNFTVQVYAKRTAAYADINRIVVQKKNTTGGNNIDPGYSLIITYSGHPIGSYKPYIILGDGTNSEQYYPTNAGDNLALNEWTNIAFVYDKTTHSGAFYLNGSAVPTTKAGGTAGSIGTAVQLSIGGYAYTSPAANAFFPGRMDELSLWNEKRTAGEIYAAMTTTLTGTETNLVAYYHFNDNNRSGQNRTVTNFCSSTGSALNGTTVGSQLTPLFDCAPPPFTSPECTMQVNGTTDYVQAPHNAAISVTQFSVGAYFKTTNTGSLKTIVYKDADGTNANYHVSVSAANKAQVSFVNTSLVTITATGTSTITDGNWHYAVGTFDGSNLRIYVDGVLEATVASGSTPITGAGQLCIGAASSGGSKFNGNLDELSVWNSALSLSQIQNLIGQRLVGNETGLVAYYNFGANSRNGQGQAIVNSCTATGSALNGISVGTSATPVFTCSVLPVTPPACSIMLNGWNDGAYMNNGLGSYPTITNNFTMEVKAKPLLPQGNATGAQYSGIFDGQRYVLGPDQGEQNYAPGHAGVGISLGTNGFAVYEHAGNYIPARIIFNNHPVNDWVHLTLVCNNGVLRLYENGALIATASASGYTLHPSGHISYYYGKYAGYVGEVRIWNTALTGDQVRANLNASLTGAEANLAGLYTFNNASANGPNQTLSGLGLLGGSNSYVTAGSNGTPVFTCANTSNVNRDTLPGSGIMYAHNNSGITFAELGNLGNIPPQGSLLLWFNAASLKEKAFVFSSSHFRDTVGGYKGIAFFSRADGRMQMTFGTDTSVTGYQDTVTV